MFIDPSRMAIAISTHLREVPLRITVENWVKTCPDYRQMYVFVHHPDGVAKFEPPPRCTVLPTSRIPEHVGCMAKTWNLAFMWAFRDPAVEWILCSMDDIAVKPGWLELVNRHAFDIYLAPCGDTIFLMHRRILRQVGWFDERFPVMGFHEWDWEARIVKTFPRYRIMMEDGHGWNINPIGLHNFWIHMGEFCPITRDVSFQKHNEDWLLKKWALRSTREFVDMMANGGPVSLPNEAEINWYPWFVK